MSGNRDVVELGDLVEDKITGFKGVVISRTEWINRCVRVCVQPEDVKKTDGTPAEVAHFDVEQIKIVRKARVVVEKPERSGGPKPAPQRARDPGRMS